MTSGEAGDLRRELDGGVLRLTIDNDERLNAIRSATFAALVRELAATADDPEIRVVVLTGAGRAFCSGADLTEISADGADADAIMDGAGQLVSAVVSAPVPVIARVNGPAVGIGMSLALACDLAYAGPDAYFLQSFLSIGLMPDGGSSLLLSAAVGRARAAELILLGRRLPAQEAAASGLVAGAATSLAELDDLVDTAAARCVAAPRRAVELTKAALRAASLRGIPEAVARESQGQQELLASAEFAERAQSLLTRRRASA
ncbi:MAG: enoyl-CoA hydratase-related protein [Lapillicoccus sp.]